MLILGLDTSGKSGGVTLAQGDHSRFHVIASSPIAGGTFSAQLVPTVAALLSTNGYTARDLEGFAAASGPGSFTGLRVGLSAVKGMAEILERPIATVSILQAIAEGLMWAANYSEQRPLCWTMLDASRSQCFLGEYECLHPVAPEMRSESLIEISDLTKRIEESGRSLSIATPDSGLAEALRYLVRDRFLLHISIVDRPSSADIARIGLRKLLAGQTVSIEALDANYLRRSDAEIFFKGNH